MPIELRRIILSTDELERAVNSYRRITNELLPDGDVDTISVNPDGTLQITVNMSYSTPSKRADFDINTDHVRDMLIRFCLENNIPIPRNGEKKPLEHEGRLVLQVRISDLEQDAASIKESDQTVSPENTPA